MFALSCVYIYFSCYSCVCVVKKALSSVILANSSYMYLTHPSIALLNFQMKKQGFPDAFHRVDLEIGFQRRALLKNNEIQALTKHVIICLLAALSSRKLLKYDCFFHLSGQKPEIQILHRKFLIADRVELGLLYIKF